MCFEDSYNYLVDRIKKSVRSIDKSVMQNCLNIIKENKNNYAEYNNERRSTVDGAGRSLESALFIKGSLKRKYSRNIKKASDGTTRPLRKGDLYIVNSRSGSGTAVEKHAKFAYDKGLDVIVITGNEEMKKVFDNDKVILINGIDERKTEYAPLGTEFEQASALICSCMGYSYDEENSINVFYNKCDEMIKSLYNNLKSLKEQEKTINSFTEIISDYLKIDNHNWIYFKGMGANEIISRVIAIRYGHLNKKGIKDLRVVYEGHWDYKEKGDLGILLSGSGATPQIIEYARQAKSVGMNLFCISSFKNSPLIRTNNDFYNKSKGNLLIEGRTERVSYYNQSIIKTLNVKLLPKFEMNTYVTLDSMLAHIAYKNGISEDDMKKTHRDKQME